MTGDAHDIFLSYGRQDEAHAERIAEAFRRAGYRVWWDRRLRSGDVYDTKIEDALRSAKAVVVLWSPRSVGSRWVRSEATVAERAGTLLPVLLEPVELPVSFALFQAADLSGWTGDHDHPSFAALLADLRQRLDVPPGGGGEMSAVELATASELRLPDRPSIAVLPFTDTGAATRDHFAEGLADEIGMALSRFRGLLVVAAHSGTGTTDAGQAPQQLGRAFGVRYLLDGKVRRAGERLRILLRVLEAETGAQVWADRYDVTLDDIFDLQDRIATEVAAVIDSTLFELELAKATRRRSTSPSAYLLTMQASAKWQTYERTHVEEGVRLAIRAMELDPHYALAPAVAAGCLGNLFMNQWTDQPERTRSEALRLVDTALHLDSGNEEVLTACAYALVNTNTDMEQSARLVERALEIAPARPGALNLAGALDAHRGEPARGLERLLLSLRLSPRSSMRGIVLWGVGHCLFCLERYEEAVEVLREALQIRTESVVSHALLAGSLVLLGRMDEARAAHERLNALGGKPAAMFQLGHRPTRKKLHLALAVLEEATPAAA
ncbi:MAG: TIR domain-containing protein [Thermaurantiacus sp.]